MSQAVVKVQTNQTESQCLCSPHMMAVPPAQRANRPSCPRCLAKFVGQTLATHYMAQAVLRAHRILFCADCGVNETPGSWSSWPRVRRCWMWSVSSLESKLASGGSLLEDNRSRTERVLLQYFKVWAVPPIPPIPILQIPLGMPSQLYDLLPSATRFPPCTDGFMPDSVHNDRDNLQRSQQPNCWNWPVRDHPRDDGMRHGTAGRPNL